MAELLDKIAWLVVGVALVSMGVLGVCWLCAILGWYWMPCAAVLGLCWLRYRKEL